MKHLELFENFINNDFSNWFEGSKVVDKNKIPLVVYHGTCHNFNFFDMKHGGKSTGGYAQKHGIFFTDNILVAESYAKFAKHVAKKGNPRIIEAYLSIKNPLTINANGKDYGEYKHVINDAVDRAKAKGRDGLIIKNFVDDLDYNIPATQYMVFNSDQIKIIKSK
jgi:hypothetical protein